MQMLKSNQNLLYGELSMIGNTGRQNEMERDDVRSFAATQYVSTGYHLHFHRNLEIYGVVKGKVTATIAGRQNVLTDGQMAIVDSLEDHAFEMEEEAEVFFFQIGTRYLSNLRSLHPQRRLPHWLMDAEYNTVIYEQIRPVLNVQQEIPELRRIGIVCQLFSDIIEHYGTVNKVGNLRQSADIVTQITQYIYENYQEKITLTTLANRFYLSPKALSKKIKKYVNMDLRVFINDIRVQRAMEMWENPENAGKTIQEIATQCGFSSMATFYRSYERNFKQRTLEEKPVTPQEKP